LPIGPAEAFVLSRIDGAANELEIAEAVGLEPDAVAVTLATLTRLGAVQFARVAAAGSVRPPRPAARPSGAGRIGPIIESSSETEPHHPAAALYSLTELDEDVDLSVERKRVILEAFHHLDDTSHYQLLKVDPLADKKTIKNAYYEIVNVFHPDRYFGKNLGSFKPKLERVFARLTEAYDTITRAGPRAEYDAYLASLAKTRALDPRHADVALEAQLRAIQRQIEDEARAAEQLHAGDAQTATQDSPPPRSLTPSTRSSSHPRPQSLQPLDAEARKRALARKLGGRQMSGSMPAVQSPSVPPTSVTPASRERAATELKRRYEQRIMRAREQRAERYLADARNALASKNTLSAVNGLRIAASLVPENAEIMARLQEAQTEATVLLADHYLAQAQYEEREGRLVEAARSYGRATLGSPNARTFERAAYCTLMSEGDLRVAGDYARKAVALVGQATLSGKEPQTHGDEAQARVTLARIYVAAGMKQSGLAEFERAATLAPKDDTIQDWIRRLKRGEA
jgi:curved DNA-binding protein CbpA